MLITTSWICQSFPQAVNRNKCQQARGIEAQTKCWKSGLFMRSCLIYAVTSENPWNQTYGIFLKDIVHSFGFVSEQPLRSSQHSRMCIPEIIISCLRSSTTKTNRGLSTYLHDISMEDVKAIRNSTPLKSSWPSEANIQIQIQKWIPAHQEKNHPKNIINKYSK